MAIAAVANAANWKEAEQAAWIADQGGRATKDAAGHIVAVDLTSTWITDADLARIGSLIHLQKLDLAHTKISDAGLEHLAGLPGVTDLNLYYAEYITEDGIAHLKNWTKLQRLNLRGTKVTSKVFDHLAHLTGLRSLDLAFTQIDDEGFEQLATLAKLEDLAIGGNRLTGACLPLLKPVTSLRRLDVGGMQRVDSGLWGLALTGYNLGRIADLAPLEYLNLGFANLSDRGADRPGQPEAIRGELRDLSPLRKLMNLKTLDLSGTPVSNDALNSLAALPNLQELRLGLANNIGDNAVPGLLALKRLKILYVAGTKMTSKGIAQLRAGGRYEKLDAGNP
ncbi:MAG: leucine-rich repeat domain-containing protein [Bryobacteraceae bacterium]